MKAFVTGSTGLLGSNLVNLLLDQGHEVMALARSPQKAREVLGESPRLTVLKGDMEDVAAFAGHLRGQEVLFHVAAYFRDYFGSGDHWPMLEKINVNGTMQLLDQAEAAGIRKVIYVSSSGVIGTDAAGTDAAGTESGGVVNEDTPPGKMQQSNLYFKSKVIAEQRLLEWLKTHSLPVVQILPTWIWGPGDAAPTAAGQLVLDFLNRKLPGIVEGSSTIVDARDVAQAMIAAVDTGRSGERYLIANQRVTLAEILRGLEKVSGVPGPRTYIPFRLALLVAFFSETAARLRGTTTLITIEGIRTLQDHADYSADKARRELGHRPRPLEETLRDSVNWYLLHQLEKIANPSVQKPVRVMA